MSFLSVEMQVGIGGDAGEPVTLRRGLAHGKHSLMDTDTDKPEVSPANGGAEPARRAPQGRQTLTNKQEKFCEGVASGLNYSDAYRAAYSCANQKASTIHRSACLLGSNPKVIARLQHLEAEDDEDAVHSATYRRVFVLEGLAKEAVDRTNTGTARIRAYELLGKTQGVDLFTDIKEQRVVFRSPGEIEAELRKRIGVLFNEEPLPTQGKVIDAVVVEDDPARELEPWAEPGPTDPD